MSVDGGLCVWSVLWCFVCAVRCVCIENIPVCVLETSPRVPSKRPHVWTPTPHGTRHTLIHATPLTTSTSKHRHRQTTTKRKKKRTTKRKDKSQNERQRNSQLREERQYKGRRRQREVSNWMDGGMRARNEQSLSYLSAGRTLSCTFTLGLRQKARVNWRSEEPRTFL